MTSTLHPGTSCAAMPPDSPASTVTARIPGGTSACNPPAEPAAATRPSNIVWPVTTELISVRPTTSFTSLNDVAGTRSDGISRTPRSARSRTWPASKSFLVTTTLTGLPSPAERDLSRSVPTLAVINPRIRATISETDVFHFMLSLKLLRSRACLLGAHLGCTSTRGPPAQHVYGQVSNRIEAVPLIAPSRTRPMVCTPTFDQSAVTDTFT